MLARDWSEVDSFLFTAGMRAHNMLQGRES